MERVRNGNGKRNPKCRSWYVIPLSTSLCLTHFLYRSLSTATDIQQQADPPRTDTDRCIGRYVYMHDLPTRFNTDMLRDCNTLNAWTDMCRFTSNSGLGPRLDASTYATDQFALDVIFHNRMKRYDCLTPDSRRASAVFVPFYAGLDVVRYLWGGYDVAARDSAAGDVVRWVRSRPEWDSMGGRDHFMVAGRTTWDFRRLTDDNSDWGSKLLLLPEVLNMTVLVLESSPWHNNDVGIPYPTYFHPAKYTDILSWQQRIRKLDRPWLFSFAGASRPNKTTSIRGVILDQCHASLKCKLLECDSKLSRCHSPTSVMELFESSMFCLQPQGDSYTRRSAFDAMIAGCVPVFFHPGSAYVQYVWHLPKNYTKYSVFIPEEEVREGKVNIEQVLSRFSEEEVKAMREEVVEMIPRLVYSDPRYSLESVKDAFDVAVEGVIRKVERIRREMRGEGLDDAVEEKVSSIGIISFPSLVDENL